MFHRIRRSHVLRGRCTATVNESIVLVQLIRTDEALQAHNFKDPDQFKPERWLDVTHNEPHNIEAFVPFCYGPGNCIGKQIAIQNMKFDWFSRLSKFAADDLIFDLGSWLQLLCCRSSFLSRPTSMCRNLTTLTR